MSGLRAVAPDSDTAWCAPGEIMVSAICVNSSSASPVAAYANGAKCAYGDGAARARIMCAPAPMPTPGQQGMSAPAGGSMLASLGLHLVSSEGNTAACDAGRADVQRLLLRRLQRVPSSLLPGGEVKCGYSDGMAKANVACMSGDEAAAKDAGLRVVCVGD